MALGTIIFAATLVFADVPGVCEDDPKTEKECAQTWAESCEDDPRTESCQAWRERFAPSRYTKAASVRESKSMMSDVKKEPVPRGCVRQMKDLKDPEAKGTVAQLERLGGWNGLVGHWSLDPGLAAIAKTSASAIFEVSGGSLKGKIVQRAEGGAQETNHQSRPIALCLQNGRFEVWALEPGGEQGAAVAFLNRGKAPLVGEHKDRFLTFNRTNPSGGASARNAQQ